MKTFFRKLFGTYKLHRDMEMYKNAYELNEKQLESVKSELNAIIDGAAKNNGIADIHRIENLRYILYHGGYFLL